MGCASSKRGVEVLAIDVYKPPPSSFAVFNINSIEEPWLKSSMEATNDDDDDEITEKPSHHQQHVPNPLLQKLNAIDDAPKTWDEVSKALEDLKPTLHNTNPKPITNTKPKPEQPPAQQVSESPTPTTRKTPRKSFSFHTLEELEAKISSKPDEITKSKSMRVDPVKKSQPIKPKVDTQVGFVLQESRTTPPPAAAVVAGNKPVKENIFILRDKLEREKEGKPAPIVKFDPLSDYPEKCPPGGEDSVVIYTTSLGGVRRTFEDCNKVRSILEAHRVVFDERDVALHGGFLNELREVLEDGGATVPRMFVKGRYIGGVEEVLGLNETGKFVRILNRARIERGVGRLGCEGCGGARFVPCLDCGGSCKIVVGDIKERCPKCNENGLVLCPICC